MNLLNVGLEGKKKIHDSGLVFGMSNCMDVVSFTVTRWGSRAGNGQVGAEGDD